VQCALLGGVTLVATSAAQVGSPPIVPALVVALGLTGTFARWADTPIHRWLPILVRRRALRVGRRDRWHRPLPLAQQVELEIVELPGFLRDARLRDAGAVAWNDSTCSLGTVEDAQGHVVSATLRVAGSGFALAEPKEQDRIVAMWGNALAGACREQTPLVAIRVTEWTGPGRGREYERFADDHTSADADRDALAAYRQLLRTAAPSTTHDVLVTVAIDVRRMRGRHNGADRRVEATSVLTDELRRLATRLDAAGAITAVPLSASELGQVLRSRCDPTARGRIATRQQSLAELAGLVRPLDAAPLATALEWDHVRIDGSLHRSYWISEWPRLDVAANWLEPLLLHPGGSRTITVHYEPVPPSRSRRAIDRDATRLATDEEQRVRTGFRVGARHHRSQRAVDEREAELVAGFAEFEYLGILMITASTLDELDASSLDYEQAAAQAGVELRPLHGRQDHAAACSLPGACGIRPRLTW
jgi:hypothetical protein